MSEGMKTYLCPGCGRTHESTPCFMGSRDLAETMLCDSCDEKRETERAEQAKKNLREQRWWEVRRVIPAELARTSENHPGFNGRVWKSIRQWVPSSGTWLVMVGKTGVSKSRMAALLLIREIEAGVKAEWINSDDFEWACTREFDDDRGDRRKARDLLMAWKKADLVMFDDFGKGTFPPSAEKHLFNLVDFRRNHILPMIFSCNTHPNDMVKLGMLTPDRGAPTIGRIMEAAGKVYTITAK